jgi:hypothetical protein
MGGYLEVLQWAHANGMTWNRKTLIDEARTRGHLELLNWATATAEEEVQMEQLNRAMLQQMFGPRTMILYLQFASRRL